MSRLVLAAALLPAALGFLASPAPRQPGALTALHARRPIMAGNWKMNPNTVEEATKLASTVAVASLDAADVDVALCVPFPFIESVKRAVEAEVDECAIDSKAPCEPVAVAAQSCFFEDSGAFTGSVSISMIKSMGVEYVLAGHSERRTLFKEDDGAINKKVRKVLDAGLGVILCIGESFDEYQANLADTVCRIELSKDLDGVTEEELARVVIAYEPVWAIGTGLTCEPKVAQKVHEGIRAWFSEKYSPAAADAMRIQYGGSVTDETVDNLMRQPDIDGCLVGGASLKPDIFSRIIHFKA